MPHGSKPLPPQEPSSKPEESPSSQSPSETTFGFLQNLRRVETTIKVFPDDGEKVIGRVVSILSREAGRMAEVRQVIENVYHVTFFMPKDDPLLTQR